MGVAILWVMMFHLPFRSSIPIIDLILKLGYGGVDIFLFLSGFGLYFSLSKGNVNLSEYYKKRFCRILPEFWIFLIITFLIKWNFSLHSFGRLIYCATTIGYWIPGTPYVLWYISCILFLYLVYPFYYPYLHKKGLKFGFIPIFIGIALTVAYAFITVLFFNNKNVGGLLILTIARIPIFFIGSIAGYLAKENIQFGISKTIKVITLIIFLLAVFSLFVSFRYFSNFLWTCSLYFLPFIFITPILCIIIAQMFNKLPPYIPTFFSKIGIISLELYLVHEYLYKNLAHILENYCGTYVAIIAIVILSFIFAFILYYINKRYIQKICKMWV